MEALHDGFFVELRELWHGDHVVALNQQTFAILRWGCWVEGSGGRGRWGVGAGSVDGGGGEWK